MGRRFPSFAERGLGAVGAVLAGGCAAAALDLAYAVTFEGLRGVPPARVLQTVASGLIGPDAYRGGAPVLWLGGVLHLGLSVGAAAAYVGASRRWRLLRTNPVELGTAYGVVWFAFMNLVVVPLSATPWSPRTDLLTFASGLASHTLFFGVPIALFAGLVPARAARPEARA